MYSSIYIHVTDIECCFVFVQARLADLVHHMGGSIRKDFSSRVTHLVSNTVGGEKYRVAVSMGTPIMSEDWVHRCWDFRNETNADATDEYLVCKLEWFTV